MQPKGFLNNAVALSTNQTEAEWRAAAHAAYYAVYHTLCAHYGLDPADNQASHVGLRRRLRDDFGNGVGGKFVVVAHRAIMSLVDLRRHADYLIDHPFGQHGAVRANALARSILFEKGLYP